MMLNQHKSIICYTKDASSLLFSVSFYHRWNFQAE